MNSNYLLSMLDLVGNSLELQQWLGPHPSHCKDNFSVVMHWTVEGSTAKHCFCQNFKGGSDWRKYIIWR